MAVFKEDNLIEAKHGEWGYVRRGGAHKGADISTGGNKTERATIAGYVEFAGIVPQGGGATWEWGWHVRIFEGQANAGRPKGTRRHVYAHNARNLVKTGQVVAAGEAVGVMGQSGNAAPEYNPGQGPHCHYQVDEWNGSAWINKDPTLYCGGRNTAGEVWRGTPKGDSTMDCFDVFGGDKNNVQGFTTANVNDIAVNHIPNGRYQVYETGVPLGGGFTGARIRYNGQKVYVAAMSGITEMTDISVADAEGRWGWYASAGGVPQAEYDALRADRDAQKSGKEAAQKTLAAAAGCVRQAESALQAARKALGE